ncbi:MAG: hypothetical protein ABL908_02005 [Hyphomicrobium sp.]
MSRRLTKSELLNSASPFAAQGMPTLADALAILEVLDIPAKKKSRIRQDTLNLCKRLGLKPDEVIAHHANLNPLLRRLTCIGEKRRTNIKNSVKQLLRCLPQKRSFKAALTPAWAAIAAVIPDRYRRTSVSCMMQYASAQEIPPDEFDDEASAGLLEALISERLNGNPTVTHQNAVRTSNWLTIHAAGWTVPKLTQPRYSTTQIKQWTELPDWCQRITNSFLDRSSTTDPFDLSRPMNAWRPATAATYEVLCRRFFSRAQHVHSDLDRPRGWREVATFKFAEPVLRWGISKNGNQRGHVMAANMASLLAQIAQNPDGKPSLTQEERNINEANAEELWTLASRLRSSKGLSAKTRSRVSILKDESALAKLFLLPFALAIEIKRSRKKRRRLALLRQWAVALMILTFCPLRISTLSKLRDRHLIWSKPEMRGDLRLELEGEMLKAGEPATIPLPRECAIIIRQYCQDDRSTLYNRDTDFLFPAEDPGTSKAPGLLSTQLSKLIKSRLGLDVNPHLYRHLVHIVILRRFPGAYTMISRVLLHRSLETAVRNYAHFDVELSMKAYQQLIREVQTGQCGALAATADDIAYSNKEHSYASRKSSR